MSECGRKVLNQDGTLFDAYYSVIGNVFTKEEAKDMFDILTKNNYFYISKDFLEEIKKNDSIHVFGEIANKKLHSNMIRVKILIEEENEETDNK